MSWQFSNAADTAVVLDIGDLPQNGSPISMWILVRRNGTADMGLIEGTEVGADRVGMLVFSDEIFCANSGPGLAGVTANEWVIIGYDDNNAGAGTVRYHLCTDLDGTPTWTHGDGPSAGDRSGVVDDLRIGHAFDLRSHGHIAAAAIADTRLGDAGFEALSLTSMGDWVGMAVAAWQFNVAVGSTAIVDLTGGGADQTSLVGTPVLDTGQEPPGWSYYTPSASPDQIRLGGAWVGVAPKFRGPAGWVTP